MKICTICKEEKSKSEFNKKNIEKDKLQPHCRECSHKRFKIYYENNKEKQKKTVIETKKKVRRNNQAYVYNYLSEHPCVVCGEDDPIVLDFDHLRDKKECISVTLAKWSLKNIIKEIEKCQILCANCHRRKTALENGNYKILMRV